MITIKTAKKYCSENISKIENYDLAVNDKNRTWVVHHRAEMLPCGKYKQDILKKFGLYWNRPAEELVFMLDTEHKKMHQLGKVFSNSQRKKLSLLKSKVNSVQNVGRHWWNNGHHNKFCYKCPGEGWTEGRICRRRDV